MAKDAVSGTAPASQCSTGSGRQHCDAHPKSLCVGKTGGSIVTSENPESSAHLHESTHRRAAQLDFCSHRQNTEHHNACAQDSRFDCNGHGQKKGVILVLTTRRAQDCSSTSPTLSSLELSCGQHNHHAAARSTTATALALSGMSRHNQPGLACHIAATSTCVFLDPQNMVLRFGPDRVDIAYDVQLFFTRN